MWIIISTFKKSIGYLAVFLLPVITFAQSSSVTGGFDQSAEAVTGFFGSVVKLINTVVPLFLAVAVVVFIWGVIRYILATSSKVKEQARPILVYGVAAITVCIAILGLANALNILFGFPQGSGQIGVSAGKGPLNELVNSLLKIINSFIPILLGIGIVIFIGGVIRTLWHADAPEYRKQGRALMFWSVITIAIILSMWGLAFSVKNTFFPGSNTPLQTSGGIDSGNGVSTPGTF